MDRARGARVCQLGISEHHWVAGLGHVVQGGPHDCCRWPHLVGWRLQQAREVCLFPFDTCLREVTTLESKRFSVLSAATLVLLLFCCKFLLSVEVNSWSGSGGVPEFR